MRPATRVTPPETLAAAAADPAVASILTESREMWRNDKYVAIARRRDDGSVSVLSVRRDDRKPTRDWRDLQRIKNDIAGPETEAIELFPAESRLVDVANQTWIWVFPPGTQLPLGFHERAVATESDPRFPAAQQRPLP